MSLNEVETRGRWDTTLACRHANHASCARQISTPLNALDSDGNDTRLASGRPCLCPCHKEDIP